MKNICLTKISAAACFLFLCAAPALAESSAGYGFDDAAQEQTLSANLLNAKTDAQKRAAYYNYGEFYFSFAAYEEAMANYQQVLSLKPSKKQKYETYIKIARSLTALERFDAALNYYHDAEFLYPSKPEAKLALAEFYFKTGLYYLAEIKFLDVLQVSPGSAAAKRFLGDIYFMQKHYRKALAYYETVSQHDKTLVLNMATCYANTNKETEALKLLSGSLDKFPNDADILLRMGQIYAHQADYGNAEYYFLETARLNNELLEPYMRLAVIYMKTGKLDEARFAVSKAYALDSGLASVDLLNAMLYFKEGSFAQAKEYANFAAAKAKSPFIKDAAARITEYLGKQTKAAI